ncbi:aldehyde dehydrogenase family protein [Streptomyces sp. CB01881]|uniref:aldehyde dehydrogenase family protein n=1 Tax=Streptomyces sp. CB01881 TaxID=2078691 RepID=UPI000CDC4BE6|nr:aldehyde dehydrogenase family protein [Streptomyces sp. CB01881]AUY49503.1 aldehyde dehydrogenase [Streptomyces sp. CB01881]TYC72889.1 aldehyde dehydrogenase family protein [Streptomyces sp. CB01881]
MTVATPAGSAPAEPGARPELDALLAELADGERRWAATPLTGRVTLLGRVHAAVAAEAQAWVRTASRIKLLADDSPLTGEEWMSGPYALLTSLDALARSLRAVAAGRSPLDGARFGRAPGGRVTVPVLPLTAHDRLLLNGFTAEVWMPPGTDAETVRRRAGLGALDPQRTGGVGLVLGAGNITSIAPLDVLYELIAHNRVVLLKLNPVLGDLEPVYRRALAPLIEYGVLRIVSGGGDVGGYLAHHPGVAHVHITGSLATHDVVAFGPGEEGRARKAAGTPLLTKPMTSELGGVSPVIVVPGEWSEADLRYQAEHIATQRLHNSGHNCIATQLVLLGEDWPQRETFLRLLRTALERLPARPAWYPGSAQRLADAAASHPGAEWQGAEGSRLLVDLGDGRDAATLETTEYFAPVLGVLTLPGTGAEFLDRAVETANRDLVGTLGANILVDPATLRRLGPAFDDALAALRYGTIAVNAWTALGFLTATAPWGAYPGHTVDDAQSGIGVVHNALLIDGPERTVVRGPFRPFPRSVAGGEWALFPKPPWFVTARSAALTGRRLTRFAARPSWARMPGVFAAAFRA